MQYLILGNSHEKILIDSEDYIRCIKYVWSKTNSNNITATINGKTTTLGRFILQYSGPLEVDHKNHNWIDCRKENLRLITLQQNRFNREIRTNNTSGYIGVFYNRKNKNWCAQITVNKKRFHLGYFQDKEKAAKVRDEAAKKYHGEFAVLNFKD